MGWESSGDGHQVSVYRCIRELGLRSHLGQRMVAVAVKREGSEMEHCAQGTPPHSGSMPGVGEKVGRSKGEVLL